MKDLSVLLPPFYQNRMVIAAFVFILVGLSIKMALFPLHTWLPDAHAFAPSEISAMLSGIIIEISTYALYPGFFFCFHSPVHTAVPHLRHPLLDRCHRDHHGFRSGNHPDQPEKDAGLFKRCQHGLHRFGSGLSISAKTSPWGGLKPALMHILNHALMKGCLFLVAGAFIYKADLWNISDLQGLGRKMPFTCAAFVVAAVSMIGVPPTVGFASKLYIIFASIEAKQVLLCCGHAPQLPSEPGLFLACYRNPVYEEREEQETTPTVLISPEEEVPFGMLLPISGLGFSLHHHGCSLACQSSPRQSSIRSISCSGWLRHHDRNRRIVRDLSSRRLPSSAAILILLSSRRPNRPRKLDPDRKLGASLPLWFPWYPSSWRDRRSNGVFFQEMFSQVNFGFRVDAFGLLFAITSSFLWILVSIYSIGYMRDPKGACSDTVLFLLCTGYFRSRWRCILGKPGHFLYLLRNSDPVDLSLGGSRGIRGSPICRTKISRSTC